MPHDWTTGYEVELLAPRGSSRLTFADRLARTRGGSVKRFHHLQQEPSEVAGSPIFQSLTAGFEVLDRDGQAVAKLVDDVTLQGDLDAKAAPKPGWHRILTDDGRIARLLMRHCSADAALSDVLAPIAQLFGTEVKTFPQGMTKVSDDRGVSIALAAPLPGERERPCEIITPPRRQHQTDDLRWLLDEARLAGFSVPIEGATHIHFDAHRLTSARAISNLVILLSRFGDDLKRMVGVNPHCIRLGKWPEALLAKVSEAGFNQLDWQPARKLLSTLGLEKYCDFNILNIVSETKGKHTFEVRVLPSTLDVAQIAEQEALFAGILSYCVTAARIDVEHIESVQQLLAALPLAEPDRTRWMRGR